MFEKKFTAMLEAVSLYYGAAFVIIINSYVERGKTCLALIRIFLVKNISFWLL